MNQLALPTTKQGIDAYCQLMIEEIEKGEVDPLVLLIARKSIETVFERIKPTLNKAAIEAVSKYGSSDVTLSGSTIKVAEYGTQYDYSGCNHPEYETAVFEFNKAKANKEAIESGLKALTKSMTLTDEDTGEVITVYPPVKTSTTVATVKL